MWPGSPEAAAAFAAISAQLGEAVMVEPLHAANEYAAAAPDNTRAVVITRAVVALSPTTDGIEGGRRGTQFQGMTRVGVRKASVWFSAVAYAGLGYALRIGDRIVLTERSASYRVAAEPRPTDRGDVAVSLTIEAGA